MELSVMIRTIVILLVGIVKEGMSTMKEVLRDSLTNGNRTWSSKRIMTFVSFNLCVFMSLVDLFTSFKLNFDIFCMFMLMASGQSVLSIIGNRLGLPVEAKAKETAKNE
jgi:hypothetical protein